MTRDELLAKLAECAANDDTENAHGEADIALVAYINDKEIAAAYDAVPRYY